MSTVYIVILSTELPLQTMNGNEHSIDFMLMAEKILSKYRKTFRVFQKQLHHKFFDQK